MDMHTARELSQRYMRPPSGTVIGADSAPTPKGPCQLKRFLRYTSSPWEQLWLDNIGEWQGSLGSLCSAVNSQAAQIHAFLNSTCAVHYDDPIWCALDDTVQTMWLNKQTGRLTDKRPAGLAQHDPKPLPLMPRNPAIFSQLEFVNDCTLERTVEYIEPLVSHLRHPLNGCQRAGDPRIRNDERSYIVPVPNLLLGQRAYYFDAGASSWNVGLGGASLDFFTTLWARHGIDFDFVEAWEPTTDPKRFLKTVPDAWASRVRFHQAAVAKDNKTHPFLPTIIRRTARTGDYVLFKLDIDNIETEQGIVDHLLSPEGAADLEFIDEFFWEHHVRNPWMDKWWANSWFSAGTSGVRTLSDSYASFLQFRQRGVRAHSWI